jgi:hypothetical protein
MTGVKPGSSCATECGDRKMPEPMMLPTVIAVAAYRPIWRLSSVLDDVALREWPWSDPRGSHRRRREVWPA